MLILGIRNTSNKPSLSLTSSSGSKYVYTFNGLNAKAQAYVYFKATFTNGTTRGINLKFSGCNGCDLSGTVSGLCGAYTAEKAQLIQSGKELESWTYPACGS